ncbi:MAG: sigma 54-interacting transcriptional regulator [Desulfobacterales bacterium]
MEQGSSEVEECQLRHKDGHDVDVMKHANVGRDETGAIIGLAETVSDLAELNRARRKANEAALRLAEIHRMDNIIGKSMAMQKVYLNIQAAAAGQATILVYGESGTGKERAAGVIHDRIGYEDLPLEIRSPRGSVVCATPTGYRSLKRTARVRLTMERRLDLLEE